LFSSAALSQREYRTHTRSMLHQTIYNTGEIGRTLEASNSTTVGLPTGTSSWEWPPNSYQIMNQIIYWGHQNSFGSGILFRATIRGASVPKACGGITDGNGNATLISSVYCTAGDINRIENYPVLADGSLNSHYDPNEAEEKIITSYRTTDPMKLLVTQTSRAWSFPGYNSFIIIEYDIVNLDTIDYTDGFVMFENAIVPSAFGMQRKYNLWDESSNTTRSREVYARYNYSRYLNYVHTTNGFPDPDFFNTWSLDGNRGGLNSPQAPGFMILHYDYDHLQLKNQTVYTQTDSGRVWDANNKFRQPYISQQIPNRNTNLTDVSGKAAVLMLLTSNRPFSAFNFHGAADSVNYANYHYPYRSVNPVANQAFMDYWHGRCKPRGTNVNSYTQTTLHYNSFGPYVFKKGEHLKFAVAELVGYGVGGKNDTLYRDAGGAAFEPAGYVTGMIKPVPNLYSPITYPGISNIAGITSMGSNYLQTHPLPWYVTGKISNADTMPVISLRDVADRAIQMYTGDPLIKYDGGPQLKPELTTPTGAYGTTTTYIPIPAPALNVYNAIDMKNKIVWGPQIEEFTSLPNVQSAVAAGRIKSGFSHYLVLKSSEALGPWKRLDSIGIRDPHYYNVDSMYAGQYFLRDTSSLLGQTYYYCIISIDSLGGRSGMTNMTSHETAIVEVKENNPTIYSLNQNYPNPFNPGTQINYQLSKLNNVSLTVYDLFGREIAKLVNGEQSAGPHSIKWNASGVASGVYFYQLKAGSFIQTKKMLLLK
jgi:hypothetical protein